MDIPSGPVLALAKTTPVDQHLRFDRHDLILADIQTLKDGKIIIIPLKEVGELIQELFRALFPTP